MKAYELERAQLLFYRENGYLVVDNILQDEECERMVRIYKSCAKPDFRGIMNLERGIVRYEENDIVEEIPVDREDAEYVWRIIAHPVVTGILESLQGGEVVNLQSMMLFKEANSPYAAQAWNPHQDNVYPSAPYGMYMTGNFAFEDQDITNGCMFIYPGSHKEWILPAEKVQSFQEGPEKNPGHRIYEVPDCYIRHDLFLPKRSVLFLHGNVIHGSYPNISPIRSRPMLLVPYGTCGISHTPGFVPGATAKRRERSLHTGEVLS